MNDQELRQIWQQQVLPPAPMQAGAVVDLMRQRMRRFDRTILWRDAREIGVCVLLIVWVSSELSVPLSGLSCVGKSVIILGCVFVTARILWTRHAQRPPLPPLSVRDSLLDGLEKVKRQIRLLQTVLWWYILPLFLGVTLDILGEPGSWAAKTLTIAFLVAVGWFVHWLNRFAVAKVLVPTQNDLEQTLNSALEFSESTNIATPKE